MGIALEMYSLAEAKILCTSRIDVLTNNDCTVDVQSLQDLVKCLNCELTVLILYSGYLKQDI